MYRHVFRRSRSLFVSTASGRERLQGDYRTYAPFTVPALAVRLHWGSMNESLFPENDPPEKTGWYTAHCDGGSRGNPGPAGYGAVIEDPGGQVVAKLSEFLGRQTNNFAEYKGLLSVLAWAKNHGARQLRVVSDSELMVKQMKGQYKVASPGLRPLWEQARRLAQELDRFEIRHTLRGGNQEADRLANEAMDKGTGRTTSDVSHQAAGSSGSGNTAQARKTASSAPGGPRLILDGYVKGGVVHLLEGDLPEGTFVKVIKE
jgi:ribonuclease HI